MGLGTGRVVLVIGAQGFLGGHIVAALRRHGYRVLLGVRAPNSEANDERLCDLVAMLKAEHWRDALAGVDVVVNAAGILREEGAQTFEAVHVSGPRALSQACIDNGVHRLVQISALGDPRDGEFIASKQRFDALLQTLPLNAIVLRPSVVYATEGSYGGTSLLRALAALPFGLWLPGDGRWQMQPLAACDLAEIVVRAVETEIVGAFEVGGPTPSSLLAYQRQWRRWLRIPGERVIRMPTWLVALQVGVSERCGRGPMGATIWRMLRRGNVTAPDASRRLMQAFGFAPRELDEVLSLHPSQVQDRWQARLYFLAPLLRAALVVLWTISGLVGLLASAATIELLKIAWLPTPLAIILARVGGGVDLAFAMWLASGWRMRWALAGMAASILVYTLAFSAWLPATWLAPLGGLAKNLVLLPALAVLWVLSDRR